METKTLKRLLPDKFRIPALVLVLGLALMLLPGLGSETKESVGPEEKLQALLCETSGVGEARVLLSDSGVVVVCRGADDAAVRLDMIRAIRSYTGFGSDKITILKLAD